MMNIGVQSSLASTVKRVVAGGWELENTISGKDTMVASYSLTYDNSIIALDFTTQRLDAHVW